MKTKIRTVTISDCRVDTFRSGGNGGQNQNKVSSGVRITHTASSAVGESRETRSQLINKRAAFKRMAESPRFQVWARTVGMGEQTIEEYMADAMRPENILVEVVG